MLLLSIPVAAQSIGFPGSTQMKLTIGDDKVYKIELVQSMVAQNGNWIIGDGGKCIMPPDLKVGGSMTLTVRGKGKSAKAIFKIVGQKTRANVVYLQTDGGINVPLGFQCIPSFSSDAPPTMAQTELNALVDDALANPSPAKLYRLAQIKSRE